MPKAIVVDFQDESELTEKLDSVREELHEDIYDRATQLFPRVLWKYEDYSFYLVPDGFKLFAENEDEFYDVEQK